MLLDPSSFGLAPKAAGVLAEVEGDARFKLELPAAQLEIVTAAHGCVEQLLGELAGARRSRRGRRRRGSSGHRRRAPVRRSRGRAQPRPALRPHRARVRIDRASPARLCPSGPRRARVGAERALAVYNALRSFLPELAALAANAPFHDGRDTGLASVRPKIAEMLPRQGIPPALSDWDDYAAALRWGTAAGVLPDPGCWWWELRPHPAFGTLELRVPDAQTTLAEAAAIAATCQALVAWLGERHDAGETLAVAPTWRISENRWSAARDGVQGTLADLETGERRPTDRAAA